MTAVLFTFALAIGANAASFLVNTTADTADAVPGDGFCADGTGSCSLRAAISEANALAGDDVITVPAGTYTQTLVAANDDLNAGGDWDITSNISITGAGADMTFLQAAASAGTATERVLDIRAGSVATVNGFTLRFGRFTGVMAANTRGAGVENLGTLSLTNCIVRDNTISSTSGNALAGGIYNANANLTLSATTVTANALSNTAANSFGGGVATLGTSTVTITNSSVSANTSASSFSTSFGFAAGMYAQDTFNLTVYGSAFNSNIGIGGASAGSNGNGIRILSNIGNAVANITNTTFNNNTGTTGTANQGIGVQLFTSTAAAATLTANFDQVSINGNVGSTLGIGMAAQATGGTMTVNVNRSTIANNTGGTNAGGVYVTNSGSTLSSGYAFTFTNSTVSGNTTSGGGGGVVVEKPATGTAAANFNFATIANNTANTDNTGADVGGGLWVLSGATANLKNTLIADNSIGTGGSAPDVAGTIVSQNYNHIEDPTGATITGTTTNNTTGDPQLGPLANNGGPTLTHLPGAGSVVVNSIPSGTNDCGSPIVNDQRNVVRPTGGACEKGSVELGTIAPFLISGRVTTALGRGIKGVTVILTGGALTAPIYVTTGSLGYYSFGAVPPGTYTVTVASKRYTFTPASHTFNLTADRTAENFTSNEANLQDDSPSKGR